VLRIWICITLGNWIRIRIIVNSWVRIRIEFEVQQL